MRSSHAVGQITGHELRPASRPASVPMPGLGTIAGISERPEGGHEAWFGYTDHTTPPRSTTTTHATRHHVVVGTARPGSSTSLTCSTEQVTYPSKDGTRCACS